MKLKDETLGNEKLHGSFVGLTDPVWGQIIGDIQDQEDLIELIDLADEQLQAKIDTEINRALKAEQTETESRLAKDTDLQNQIDSINARSDVVDVVGTKQELIDYSKPLTVNDIVKVLKDESYNNATTYYRYIEETTVNKLKALNSINGTTYTWSLVGSIGPYYTTTETDTLLADEKAAREAMDLLLQSNLNAEINTRVSEVARLDKRIDDESIRAKSAESALTANLNFEISRAKEAESTLTTSLNEEINRAKAAEAELTTDLSAEISKKVNTADIIDNLTTEEAQKPLSANQGKILKDLIDNAISVEGEVMVVKI